VNETRDDLGEIIRLRRRARNISSRELGEFCGLSKRAINLWESGRIPYSIESFLKICAVLDMGQMFTHCATGDTERLESAHGPTKKDV